MLSQSIIHDHVEAVQERRSFNNCLVVGIIKTLQPNRKLKWEHLDEHQEQSKTNRQQQATKQKSTRRNWDETCSSGSADATAHRPFGGTQQEWSKRLNVAVIPEPWAAFTHWFKTCLMSLPFSKIQQSVTKLGHTLLKSFIDQVYFWY